MAIALPNANALIQLQKNQPNGLVGIDTNGDVVGTFSQRVGTAAEISAVTLRAGELAYTSDNREIFIGDGTTAGGLFLYQSPRIQTRAYGPGLTNAPTTLAFPKVLGAKYRVQFDAAFSGDSSNTSNFALVYASSAYPAEIGLGADNTEIIKARWFDASTKKLIEERYDILQITASAFGFSCPMVEAGNMTRTGARLSGDMEVGFASDSYSFGDNLEFSLATRTGATSPATGYLRVICQRIA